jgi:hypothetical protein
MGLMTKDSSINNRGSQSINLGEYESENRK